MKPLFPGMNPWLEHPTLWPDVHNSLITAIRDTLADVHQWGWWSGRTSAPHGLGSLANEFAAMPSLHVAWALWAGCLIARHARRRAVRIAGLAYPMLTGLVVMSTGNHYLLDVLAGAAVISVAAAIATLARVGRGHVRFDTVSHRGVRVGT